MVMQILCETCAAVMGTVEKDVITDEDIALYRAMMTCPNGHHVADLSEVDDGDDDGGS